MEKLIKEKYEKWLKADLPQDLREQLESLNEEEINDCFYCDVEFGTAGIRGVLGPGSNRLNIYVIRKVSKAFAEFLLKFDSKAKESGVVISHDNRLYSREFTLESAKMLASYGIKVYIFDSLRPTPELSFAVRKMHAAGGIMITASHNPKEYNGFKVYDREGCQLTPSKIKPYIDIINTYGSEIDTTFGDSEVKGDIITLGKDVDIDFIEHVESILLNPQLSKENFKIVFTPQHGTSLEIAKMLFSRLGYDVVYVKEQCSFDPLFSSTPSPNPEDPRAYGLALEYAKKENADIIMVTDPDADRCGIAFKDSKGEYQLYTGNQTGALLIDYVLSQRKAKGLLHKNGVLFDSVVTSSFGQKVARSYGISVESVLTGFKFIGDRIKHYEETKEKVFEFGYEESYGYVLAPFVRDKDSLQALLMIAEMTNYHLKNGKTLDVVYDELQQVHGYHFDKLFSIYFEGQNGKVKMDSIMSSLRENPLKEVNGVKVSYVEDYKTSRVVNVNNELIRKIDLLPSDMLKYFFEDGSTIAIRPSGTEPKCKFYYGAVGTSQKEVNEKPDLMHKDILRILGL